MSSELEPRQLKMRASTICVLLVGLGPASLTAQAPVESEVRQIVTFDFLPGRFGEALAVFRERAIPLYEKNQEMLTFSGFREEEPSAAAADHSRIVALTAARREVIVALVPELSVR